MRASCYWKWIRGDLHSERRSREPKLESGSAVTDKRERWQGEKQGDGEREKRGEERSRSAGRRALSCGLLCVCAAGQTDGERRERRQPQMKGWEAERQESRSGR